MVPVLSAMPVLFIDQYGRDEDPQKSRYGETRALCKLLSFVHRRGRASATGATSPHQDRTARPQDAGRARLVVIAGVADPGPAVSLLREFVTQGGQLLIAAGGDFDPAAWTRSAWLDGAGILPAPLRGATVRPDTRGGQGRTAAVFPLRCRHGAGLISTWPTRRANRWKTCTAGRSSSKPWQPMSARAYFRPCTDRHPPDRGGAPARQPRAQLVAVETATTGRGHGRQAGRPGRAWRQRPAVFV